MRGARLFPGWPGLIVVGIDVCGKSNGGGAVAAGEQRAGSFPLFLPSGGFQGWVR